MKRLLLAGVAAVLTGCAAHSPGSPDAPALELTEVPFFAQRRYQCGPAALAMTLRHAGAEVQPGELVPLVYVPGRRGSFQVEMKAAVRAYGRLPYDGITDAESLIDELAAGRPVLVLQNLGFEWWPQWHYAVVVGFDPGRDAMVLRSGTKARKILSTDRFLQTWERAGRWALVALRPGELPASAGAAAYLRALIDSAPHLASGDAEKAFGAGLARWPNDPDLLFAAGNHAREQEQPATAAALYRRALEGDPAHPGALNNYADLLLAENCLASAARLMAGGPDVSGPPSLLRVLEQTGSSIDRAIAKRGRADLGSACGRLIAPPFPSQRSRVDR